jgi:S-methylmethionine-dependent homocysteine/selenocysteine methylase
MNFRETAARSTFILTEGAVIERLKRNPSIDLDPHILHAGLIYDDRGRSALERIYRGYIEIGIKYNLPFLVSAPTWRANPERIKASKFHHRKSLNADCVRFIQSLRKTYKDGSKGIYIGGLMACHGDAYRPEETLSVMDAANFHKSQAAMLAESEVDFILAATLPAVSEARGMAAALSDFKIPYILSFVIRPDGTILDGTPLHQAFDQIDAAIQHPPFFYLINCVHPSVFSHALKSEVVLSNSVLKRLWGLQANTSAKSPEELDGLSELDGSEPRSFARELLALYHTFGIKIIGGCCGTDHHHIEAIAEEISQIY